MPSNIYQSEFTGEQMDARFAAVAELQSAVSALETAVAAKYAKPADGIPSTDMDAAVQNALAKALTAVQSLADYYTKSETDALLAAIAASVNATAGVTAASLPTASASTVGKMYYIGPDGNGEYARYVTAYDGTNYSWLAVGTTDIDLTQYATKAEVSQLDQELNGGTVTQTITKTATAEGYRMPRNGGSWTTSSATGYNIEYYPVNAGKTYHLVVPKLSSQYSAVYGFGTSLYSPPATYSLPDPVVQGPVTDAEYDIVIPAGITALYVGYEVASGSPTLTTQVQAEGLVERVADVEELAADNKEDIDGLTERLDAFDTSEVVTLPVFRQVNAYINPNGPALRSSSDSIGAAVYMYDISQYRGKTLTLVCPAITNTQYHAHWGLAEYFSALPNPLLASSPGEDGAAKTIELDLSLYPTANYLFVEYLVAEIARPSVTTTVGSMETLSKELTSMRDIEVMLPDVIDAVVNDTLQIFYRGIVRAVNPYNYDIVVDCDCGMALPRYYQLKPTASEIGQYSFKVSVLDEGGLVIAQKSSILKVSAAPTSPATQKNILCFGASTTAHGEWVAEAFRRLTGTGGTPSGNALSNIAFCGALTLDGAGYFGVGGWNWSSYVSAGRAAYRFYVTGVTSLSIGASYTNNGYTFTIFEINVTDGAGNVLMYYTESGATPEESGTLTKSSGSGDATITFTSAEQDSANPLWDATNEKMTFIPYANSYCNGQIDEVFVLLGTNGLGVNRRSYADILDDVKTFADTLHTEFPAAKLVIMGTLVPSVNGGLGRNYGATSSGYSNKMGLIRSVFGLWKAYQEFANDADYSGFVTFIDCGAQFDSEYGYPYAMRAVDTRIDITERQDTNGVHPSAEGYGMIADAVYRKIVADICQP